MLEIIRIPALKDNYIWLLRQGALAVAVDPGDARPVFDALQREKLTLRAILLTHHHEDHQGGVADLLAAAPVEVFTSAAESITGPTAPWLRPLSGGETIWPGGLDAPFEVLSVPGHTRGHLAFYGAGGVFCGDVLFAGGCGRVFEGTRRQMYDSLQRLAELPDESLVYCAHEYTESNLRFALAVEPGNCRLRQRADEVAGQRAQGLPTVPSTLALEKATNPFLRCAEPEVVAAARRRDPRALDPADVFAVLRAWKDKF